MGQWGTGLYSDDFGRDLRSSVAAVARLPYSPDELTQLLCDTEPGAADHAGDPGHTTFWLVVADQFARRGILSERARRMAATIIESGSDLQRLEQLGMRTADLSRRRQILNDLKQRIANPDTKSRRSILKKPQPLLMDQGEMIVFPTCGGECINPYFASVDKQRVYTNGAGKPWAQDGWSALWIVDCGRAFHFLAWYRPLVLYSAMVEQPDLDILQTPLMWNLQNCGTCSASHYKKMRMAKIGALPVNKECLEQKLAKFRPGTSAAVSDISIANQMRSTPAGQPIPKETKLPGRAPRILGIAECIARR